ncbi:MAG: sodium:proton antiporter NhaD, partial [Cryomorphaceae bacterium]
MTYTLMLVVFVLGYAAIAFEHQLKIDKAAAALVTGVLTWTLYIVASHHYHEVEEHLLHHLSEISSILFFLIGAMTIVELVDAHEGFAVITDRIKTTNKVKLMWIIGILSFFFSAALDNLTTSIVMVSLLRKLIADQKDRWFFAGMVVVAANAGGAWSPIGDVTTTMLWIKGQITAGAVVTDLIVPSLFTLLAPLVLLSFRLKGDVTRPLKAETADHYLDPTTPFERNFVFFAGVAGLVFVPIFKTVTHLPPFMGMMLSLGVLWLITD